jgi:hypothetical protein
MNLPSKNRNFGSPLKLQTSIIAFTASGKKQKINQTPERHSTSPLNRSFLAIAGSPRSPPSVNKSKSTNQFEALREEEEEDEENDVEAESGSEDTVTTESTPSKKSSIADSLEKKKTLLSRKLIVAVRNLK